METRIRQDYQCNSGLPFEKAIVKETIKAVQNFKKDQKETNGIIKV